MTRITFKLKRRATGLLAVGAGPRGHHIKINGVEVGSVVALGGDWRGPLRGWYFYANIEGRHVNTSGNPCATAEEAKAAAKAWLLSNGAMP